MERLNFSTNTMIPGALSSTQWDQQTKDMILKSLLASERGIAQMTLNVERFAAIAEDGQEHFIMDFPGQRALTLHGLTSGKNIRTRSIVRLPQGRYTKLRFYIIPFGNTFTYQNRDQEPMVHFDYLDFDIEDGLVIRGRETAEFLLRFDFPRMHSVGVLRAVENFVKKLLPVKVKYAGG